MQEKWNRYYNKIKEWVEKHPYAAAGIVAGVFVLLYWFFTRNSELTVGEPVETTSKPSSAPYGPAGALNYPTGSVNTSDLAAARQSAITDLNNQVAAARENLKSSLQSSAVRSAVGNDQNILGTIAKIAQGLFDNKIDSKLKNDLSTGALPASILVGGSPKGMGAGVLDEFFGTKADTIIGALPETFAVPSTLTPFATNGPYVGYNNYTGGGVTVPAYLGDYDYSYEAAPGWDWNDYTEMSYNYDPYTEVYQPNYDSSTWNIPEWTSPGYEPDFSFDYPSYDFTADWGGGAYSENGYW
jgi:hypothetical protein